MKITVVGTDYVGLVTGACFAEMGNTVTCVDGEHSRVNALQENQLPVYEPGLDSLIRNNQQARRLLFTTDLAAAISECSIIILAIGDIREQQGDSKFDTLLTQAAAIATHLQQDATVIIKSTTPVGSSEKVAATMAQIIRERGCDYQVDVVANPEFLKEGTAVDDFMRPDRIIIGTDSERARECLRSLYQGFSRNHDKLMFMGVRDAELTKYTANAMLATKISFMNEIANLAEHMGVDIEQVRKGIGSDSRIGYSFIYPGCGYGGSYFPNDVQALMNMGEEFGYQAELLHSVAQRNSSQKQRLFDKLVERFGDNMSGRTVAIWGLAFKPGSADMMEATSITLINALLSAGANIRAYDPAAMDTARQTFPDKMFDSQRITLCEHQYDALIDADAMVLVTEWKPFRHPDFNAVKKLLKQAIIIDGRNQYDPHALKAQGFDYAGIGRDHLG